MPSLTSSQQQLVLAFGVRVTWAVEVVPVFGPVARSEFDRAYPAIVAYDNANVDAGEVRLLRGRRRVATRIV